MIWKSPINLDDINEKCRNSLCGHLGIEFTDVGDSHLTATMPVDRRTNQPMGILHGGATCALIETVGSVAANFCIQPDQAAVGMDINVNHMRQVNKGIVTAIANPLHIGRTTQVWEIKVYHEEKLTAAGRLTIAVIVKK
jgi:1,4-dihydroxy-2-naphthoyl-CoA hydrolase